MCGICDICGVCMHVVGAYAHGVWCVVRSMCSMYVHVYGHMYLGLCMCVAYVLCVVEGIYDCGACVYSVMGECL